MTWYPKLSNARAIANIKPLLDPEIERLPTIYNVDDNYQGWVRCRCCDGCKKVTDRYTDLDRICGICKGTGKVLLK